MKSVINLLLERLFINIPFSRESENIKSSLENKMLQEYNFRKDKGEDEIDIIRDMLKDGSNIKSLYHKYNYGDKEIEPIISSENVLTQKEVKRNFKTCKRYIIIMSLCSVFLLNLFYVTVCYFDFKTFFMDLFVTGIISGIMIFAIRNKKKFIYNTNFFQCKMDYNGKEFIKKMHDRYTKRTINIICILAAFVFYILFTIILSVFSLRYNTNDILQQISYNSFILMAIIFLSLKNLMYNRNLGKFFIRKKTVYFYGQLRKIILCSIIYWAFFCTLLIILSEKIKVVFNVYLLVICLYFIILLLYNLTLRKKLVFKNIVVNVKRLAVFSLVIITGVLYIVMSSDTYYTQPYINKVSVTGHNDNSISYNGDTGVYTITTDKDNFKILQLTDIHLGGSLFSVRQDIKALDACYTLIKETEPDFVVVTGDIVFPMGVMSFSLNNRAPVEQFAAFMRNTGIPWAFTYGNHDTEAMACITAGEFDELMKSLSFKSSGNLLYPYIQPDIYGRSNQLIEIRHTDGTLMQALFLIDSNDYIPGAAAINEYDYIRDDQVEWYKKNVLALNKKENRTIDSMVFFHIPLQEYKIANDLYESGSDEVVYYYGILGETMIDKICCSAYHSKLFDTAAELGSTKAMFCGHDHYNNQSLEYKGIRLTYGYSIDYLVMPGIEEDTEQRGATLITIGRHGGFEIQPYQLALL